RQVAARHAGIAVVLFVKVEMDVVEQQAAERLARVRADVRLGLPWLADAVLRDAAELTQEEPERRRRRERQQREPWMPAQPRDQQGQPGVHEHEDRELAVRGRGCEV